ncbi:MAG: hypothetical protein RJB38_2410 [Pseudomonadota bacterium]|jgi:hypothetical protein
MRQMRRIVPGFSLVEILLSVSFLTLAIYAVSFSLGQARRTMVWPLLRWQGQVTIQSVADILSALNSDSWKKFLQMNTQGVISWDKNTLPWLAGWESTSLSKIQIRVTLRKEGKSPCVHPSSPRCTDEALVDELEGWSREIVITAELRARAADPSRILEWRKVLAPVRPEGGLVFVFGGTTVCCPPDSIRKSCIDVGNGQNHGVQLVGTHCCRAFEGSANYGSPGGKLTCQR